MAQLFTNGGYSTLASGIPAKAVEAEAKRQVVRDKYSVMQTEIDAATSIEELKASVQR